MFIDNKYAKWYFKIVESARKQFRSGYTERHHVVPKSIGGGNDDQNIVCLTAREHFVCHRLLVKMTYGVNRQKMAKALWVLRHVGDQKLTSRSFAVLREEFSQAQSSYQRGVPKSKEHRANISAARIGMTMKISEEAKLRKSEAIKASNSRRKGVPRSAEVKQRLKGMGAGASNPRAKTWTLQSESGEIMEMKGIKPWCVRQGLVQATLKKTLGTNTFYKGYRVLSIT